MARVKLTNGLRMYAGVHPKLQRLHQAAAARRGPVRQARQKHSVVAVREIRKYQKSTKPLIPKTAFNRLVREIMQDFKPDMRIQPEAFAAMQEAVEEYVVTLFQESNMIAVSAKRETVSPREMQLARRLRGETGVPRD